MLMTNLLKEILLCVIFVVYCYKRVEGREYDAMLACSSNVYGADEERAHHRSIIFSQFGVDICGVFSRMDVIESELEAYHLLEKPINFILLELDTSMDIFKDEVKKLQQDMESGINDETMRNRAIELSYMEESNRRKWSWIRKKTQELRLLFKRIQEDLYEVVIEIEEVKSYHSNTTSTNIETIASNAM